MAGGALLLVLAACGDRTPTSPAQNCPPSAARAPAGALSALAARLAPPPSPHDPVFAAAGREFGVPADLLRTIAWVETRDRMVAGEAGPGDRPAAFGVMALRGSRLERGAALARVATGSAQRDVAANVRAAAALLDAEARAEGIDRGRPGAWSPVVAAFSGIELPAGRIAYARDDVMPRFLAAAAAGGAASAVAVGASPQAAVADDCPAPTPTDSTPTPAPGSGPDEPSAVWRPSPNFDMRMAGDSGVPHMVIIHTCEGAYTGCWSWLVNSASQVSAHYVVNEDGGEVSQLVREANRAWHIGARYDCALDDYAMCWLNGVQSNHFTIGIEHAGYAGQGSWPAGEIETSARLVCDITRRHDIPRDWQHIVGHGQLQPENRSDPGAAWPWTHYMALIQHDCGEIVVDDANARNETTTAKADALPLWVVSRQTPGYYGDGYRQASAAPDGDDPLVFSFRLDSAATRAIDVRWIAGADRTDSARFTVVSAAGDTVTSVTVDERSGGGSWHALGSWALPAGWTRVLLSRRGADGTVVVGDAVRARTPE